MLKLWNFFDGRKTFIGTLIFFVAMQLQQYGLVDTTLLKSWDIYALQIGTIVTVFGLLHKAVKVAQ